MGILSCFAHLRSVFCATPRISAASAVFTYSDNFVLVIVGFAYTKMDHVAHRKSIKPCTPATAAPWQDTGAGGIIDSLKRDCLQVRELGDPY